MLILSDRQPFARGGNRLVFVHPQDDGKCVKILLPGRGGAELRARHKFPRSLRAPSHYDDNNREEASERYISQLATDDSIFNHIPRYYGWAKTDMGRGRVSQLMRDYNGKISQTLKQKIAQLAPLPLSSRQEFNESVRELKIFLQEKRLITRKLTPQNILSVRVNKAQERLYIIEGFGAQEWLPVVKHVPILKTLKIRRTLRIFDDRIASEFAALRA